MTATADLQASLEELIELHGHHAAILKASVALAHALEDPRTERLYGERYGSLIGTFIDLTEGLEKSTLDDSALLAEVLGGKHDG